MNALSVSSSEIEARHGKKLENNMYLYQLEARKVMVVFNLEKSAERDFEFDNSNLQVYLNGSFLGGFSKYKGPKLGS